MKKKKGFTPKNSFWNFKGFTLLELLITIIILGILAAIAIPIYTSSVERARGDACISNMRAIFAAWRIYNIKEVTDYDPGGFRTVNQINGAIGTVITENNFGDLNYNNNYGFYINYYPPSSPPERYYLSTYRQSGAYSTRRIYCYYYPNGKNGDGTGLFYEWLGNWPWLPEDE